MDDAPLGGIVITQNPWFGPRRFGYGWTPIRVEGWLTIGAFVAGTAAALIFLPAGWKGPAALVLVVVLCGACWLTSGPPGHRRSAIRGRSVEARKRLYDDTRPRDPSISDAVDRLDRPHDAHPEGEAPDLR